jgi:hypothetical protein
MLELKKAHVPSVHSWILNDYRSSGCDKTPKSLRSEVNVTSLLLLDSFGFLTLYSKVDLVHLKSCMKVLINSGGLMLKFLVLLVQEMTLNFRYLWLKSRQEKSFFETLHNFKVEEAPDSISWSGFFNRQFAPLFWSLCL